MRRVMKGLNPDALALRDSQLFIAGRIFQRLSTHFWYIFPRDFRQSPGS